MQSCYKHPKLHAVIQCRKCKIPVCCHCVQEDYCPDCFKQVSFIKNGKAEAKPRLVEAVATRSRTMDLVIERLQRQAFDPDAASREKHQARNVIKQVQASKRKPVVKGRSVIKTRVPMNYGFLLPNVSPLIKVTRSPLSRLAMVAVAFFTLGLVVAQTRTTYAQPAPVLERSEAAVEAVTPAEAPAQVTHYKPVYIFVPSKAAAAAVAPIPHAAPVQPVHYSPAVAPIAIASQVEDPRVVITYPSAGATLSGTGYMQVRVAHPEQVRMLKVMLDDQPLMAADAVGPDLKIPFDTTSLSNGAHTLKVIGSSASGQVVMAPETQVSVLN